MAFALAVVGCASTDYRGLDAIERAQLITKHMKDGRFLMTRVARDADSVMHFERTLAVFNEARDHFRIAVELDDASGSMSARPRLMLGKCLQALAFLYTNEANSRGEVISGMKRRGVTPLASLVTESEAFREAAQEAARQSNNKLVQYVTFARSPQPLTFEAMARNHEILGQWREAANSMRTFVKAARLEGRIRVGYEKVIRGFEERAVAVVDEGA